MESDDVVHHMSLYNFKAPINTTIFEDNSEDEVDFNLVAISEKNNYSEFFLKKELNEEIAKNQTSTKLENTVKLNETESNNHTNYTCKRRKPNDISCDQKETINDRYGAELTVIKNKSQPVSSGAQDGVILDLKECENKEKLLKLKQYDLPESIKYRKIKPNSHEDQNIKNYNGYNTNSNKNQQTNKALSSVNCSSIPCSICSKIIEENEDAPDTLTIIARYLVNILDSYHCQNMINNKKHKQKDKEKTKKRYLEIKYHFFKASYDIVYTEIIPHKNDSIFIEQLMTKIIDHMEKKNIAMNTDFYKQINYLFKEMLNWVKQRKRNEPKVDQKKNINANKKLAQPVPTLNKNDFSELSKFLQDTNPIQKSNTKCLFKTGPPGSEIIITTTSDNTSIPNNLTNRLVTSSNSALTNHQPNNISQNKDLRSPQNTVVSPAQAQHLSNNVSSHFTNLPSDTNGHRQNQYYDTSIAGRNKDVRSPQNTVVSPARAQHLINNASSHFTNLLSDTNAHRENQNYDTSRAGRNKDVRIPQNTAASPVQAQHLNNNASSHFTILPSDTNAHRENLNNDTSRTGQNKDVRSHQNTAASPAQAQHLSNDASSHFTILPSDTNAHREKQNTDTSRAGQNKDVRSPQNTVVSPARAQHLINNASSHFTNLPSDTNAHRQNQNYNTSGAEYSRNITSNDVTNPNILNYLLHKQQNLQLTSPYQTENYNVNMSCPNVNIVSKVPVNSITPKQNIPPNFLNNAYRNIPKHYVYKNSMDYCSNIDKKYFSNIPVNQNIPNQKDIDLYNYQFWNAKLQAQAVPVHHDMIRNISRIPNMHRVPIPQPFNHTSQSNIARSQHPYAQVQYTAPHPPQNNYPMNNITRHNLGSRPQSMSPYEQWPRNVEHIRSTEMARLTYTQSQSLHPPPPPYPVNRQLEPKQNVQQPNEQAEIIYMRSSISTDSGIASPMENPNQMTALEDIMNDLMETEQSLQLPTITHITSLHPNASYLKMGNCYVCRNTAKTTCSVCFNVYYCSTNCQEMDWTTHMLTCKPKCT